MNLNLYSIYDRKVNVYLTPFPARGDQDALRQVRGSLTSADIRSTPIGQHPEDFDLVKIGSFDDETGAIKAEMPLILAAVSSLLAPVGEPAQLPS